MSGYDQGTHLASLAQTQLSQPTARANALALIASLHTFNLRVIRKIRSGCKDGDIISCPLIYAICYDSIYATLAIG